MLEEGPGSGLGEWEERTKAGALTYELSQQSSQGRAATHNDPASEDNTGKSLEIL